MRKSRNSFNLDKWQEIQDSFSAITGVSLRTVDTQCQPLTEPSREPRLCRNLIKPSALKNKICDSCLPTFLGGEGVVDKNLSFVCENVGFTNFAAPLNTLENKNWGYVIAGPVVLVKRKSREEYQGLAEELGITLETLWSAILEIKVVSFHGIQSMLELIRDVGTYTIEKEAGIAPDSPDLKRILDVLLDVAFEVTSADIGSVMFLDRNRETLSIKASRGLDSKVVNSARVKLGQGICGVAAREGEPFLIDDNSQDNRIKTYLNRPHIASSMILPLKLKNQVIGVMNLGTSRDSSVRFNPNNISVMNSLIDLTTTVLKE
ncbi:MAG: PocR ligand-binding domain-containing protein [Candidatus Omnitrophota bacterium]